MSIFLLLTDEQMLAASGVIGNTGIGFGGTDTEGTQDPAAKGNVFEENLFE